MPSSRKRFSWLCGLPTAILAIGFLTMPLGAYNAPVDSAGPLTVRIDGPSEVTETDAPLPVRVVIENRGDHAVRGTLRLGVIDRWRIEPAEAVKFSVEAGGKATCEFTVTAGKGTYSAHYPVHAFARFKWAGKSWTAHPVLVLQTKLPQHLRPGRAIPFRPVRVPEAGMLALSRLPVARAVIAVFGETPSAMPIGWQGTEERTGANVQVRPQTLGGKTRTVLVVHPPWRDGHVGTLLVEYPLLLPESKPLRLRFANAVTPTGHGDGVTFRVRVVPLDAPVGKPGEVVFERHSDAHTWLDGEADLSKFAGQAVRLQLESHPGPKHDTGWDQSYWAEPTLAAGSPPEPLPFPPKEDAGSQHLGQVACGSERYDVRVWPGRRGLLDGVVGFSRGDRRLFFRGFEVRVPGGRIDDGQSPILLTEAVREQCADGYRVRHRFQSSLDGTTFDLVIRLFIDRGVLRAAFHLENVPEPKPWSAVYLEDVACGPWSRPAECVYAGAGNVIREPGPFRLSFDGHRLATSFVGFDFEGGPSLVQGVDVPPSHLDVRPDQRRYSLHAPHAPTLTFIPADNVWKAVRTWHDVNGLVAAGGVRKLAGRFVFDLWGGRYEESAASLRRSFRYGLTDSLVVWHNWQRWGYDYRLPDIYPPNPAFGTIDQMRTLIAACKKAGALVAMHDNYIDFYPDAPGFSYAENIAMDRSGRPVKAWLNEGRGARSYRYRADRVEPFLKANLRRIHENLGPSAYFIDVWSSVRPYDYWTADGRLFTSVQTRDTWGRLFAWIRDLLGDDAPQISESGHDQLIGYLDGAQANHLRVGRPVAGRYSWCVWDWRCADAERIPWLDAAHHDRFVLHGAGYSSRYQGGLDARLHGIYSDDYIATEVLTGHPAMASRPFGRDVVRKYWLLHDLGRALALRRIEGVEFAGGDLHRQHVRWSGGGEIWVNRGRSDWPAAGRTLSQYGFFARVPTQSGTVEASICRRSGIVVETARSPEAVYVNGRQTGDEPVDFGPAVTRGGCRLARDGDALVVTPLPPDRGPAFTVGVRWSSLPWKLPRPTHVTVLSEEAPALGARNGSEPAAGKKPQNRRPVRWQGDVVQVVCTPGEFAYRLSREE